MKKVFKVLKYIRNYKGYASLNILFNILSVFFSVFSITMIAPFLDLLFLKDPSEYQKYIEKGAPAFTLSAKAAMDIFYYHLSLIIFEKGRLGALIFICVLTLIFFFLKNTARYLAMYFLSPVRNGVVKDLRNEVNTKALSLPLSYYTNERKGDIMSRMTTDVMEIEWSVMSSLEMLFRDPITIISILAVLIGISPELTIFVFALLPIPGFIIGKIASSLRRSSVKGKERLGTLFSMLEEMLSGLRIIKGFNAEKPMDEKFRNENNLYTRIQVKMYRKADLASPLSEFLGVVVLVIIIYFGGKLVIDNNLSATVFIMYIAFFSQILPPSKALTVAYYNIQKGVASLDRIEKILKAEDTITEIPSAKNITSFEKEIEYRDISFAYREKAGHVLKNINLKITKGKTIALVGQSGSGKTTLADMLPRFYDPTSGEIYIDGVPVREAKIKDLRRLLGIVTQESILFNDTVYNNIAFGITNAKEEDVIHAARVANAHDFIMEMPEHYQANIGDRGSKLSGGQRQRISIARAVLKNPPILILDEATSALDTESERVVQDALQNLMKDRTSIIIAHRLSTIQHADEIIVLQKGEIMERGTHSSLLAKNGAYKKLHDMQSFV